MADPRFYDNRGPFRLAELCASIGLECPPDAAGDDLVFDVAGLAQAGPSHLTFNERRRSRSDFLTSKAGWCLVGRKPLEDQPGATILLRTGNVGRAFITVASRFYPDHELDVVAQDRAVHPSARLGENVVLAPGVVIGPNALIGDGVRIGANAVIGRGVTIGRRSMIGTRASISFSLLGDEVLVQAGASIGGSGFGFSSGADGHLKMPQLGRVIIQDRVEIGANVTIDRGALADTVLGEGTKIDNLVQIGHNSSTGRHCIMAGQSGLSGSVTLGDFVIVGGKTGISDHLNVGDRVRLAGLSGVTKDLESGRDFGGIPARPIRDWHKETAAVAELARKRKQNPDE